MWNSTFELGLTFNILNAAGNGVQLPKSSNASTS